jgi:hypothetical protein
MGARVSTDTRSRLAVDYQRVQSSVFERTRYAHAVRRAVAAGAHVVLSAQHGSGKRSNVRTACFVAPGAGTGVASDCQFVAVLKCLGGADASASAPFGYDAAVASMLTRLVEARVSPHFTMLYHASAPLHSQPGTPCMLLERNECTLSKFLADSGELPAALQFAAAFQVAHAVLAAFVAFGVSHNDLHRQNVMGAQVDAGLVYTYEVFGTVFRVPLHGWLWKLIDFDHADIGMSHRHARYVWDTTQRREPGKPPVEPIYTFGPATDVSSGMPDTAKRLCSSLVSDFLRDRGTSSPAVQIEALLRVLHECCVRAGGAARPMAVADATDAAAAMFSLNNDASGLLHDEPDGLGIAIHSARTYTLRDSIAPVEKVVRTLVGLSDATVYRVPAPATVVIHADAVDEVHANTIHAGAADEGEGKGDGADAEPAGRPPKARKRARPRAAADEVRGRAGDGPVKTARAAPEVIVISSSSSSSSI